MNQALLAVCCSILLSCASVRPLGEADHCQRDLGEAIGRVARNYPGFTLRLERIGRERLSRHADACLEQAGRVGSAAECDALISKWLEIFEEGHLQLVVPRARRPAQRAWAEEAALMPQYIETPTASIIRLPTFSVGAARDIEALLREHDHSIRSRDTLILDLRGNGGGGDSSYRPLLPYVYSTRDGRSLRRPTQQKLLRSPAATRPRAGDNDTGEFEPVCAVLESERRG